MAREKSFLPPEEMKLEQPDVFEEELVQKSEVDQKAIEELLAKGSPAREVPSEQETLEQPSPVARETLQQPIQQAVQEDSDTAASQTITERASQQETISEIEESVVSGSAYTVQVGYFSVESNARGLATEIENHGFQTHILKHNDAYKVQVGAYQMREQAEKASQELKNLGYEIWVTQR